MTDTPRAATAADLPAAVAAALAQPVPGRERIVDAAGYAWRALEWGDPAGAPLLLVHGVTSSAETFWRVGPAVAAVGRRVLAVDLPGHGRTGGWRGRHRFAETAVDLAGFIRAAGLGGFGLAVLGHSWGGMVASALPTAGFRPERLILLDPPSMRLAALVPLTEDPLERRYGSLADALAAVRASGVSWSEGDMHAKAIALTQVDEAAARAIVLENGDFDGGLAALAHPAARDIPVWIIRGEFAQGGMIPDEDVPALAVRVGADHITTIAGAPHSPQRTHPEATVLAILHALA